MPEFDFGTICVEQSVEQGMAEWFPNTVDLGGVVLNSVNWYAQPDLDFCPGGYRMTGPWAPFAWRIALFGSLDGEEWTQLTGWKTSGDLYATFWPGVQNPFAQGSGAQPPGPWNDTISLPVRFLRARLEAGLDTGAYTRLGCNCFVNSVSTEPLAQKRIEMTVLNTGVTHSFRVSTFINGQPLADASALIPAGQSQVFPFDWFTRAGRYTIEGKLWDNGKLLDSKSIEATV